MVGVEALSLKYWGGVEALSLKYRGGVEALSLKYRGGVEALSLMYWGGGGGSLTSALHIRQTKISLTKEMKVTC